MKHILLILPLLALLALLSSCRTTKKAVSLTAHSDSTATTLALASSASASAALHQARATADTVRTYEQERIVLDTAGRILHHELTRHRYTASATAARATATAARTHASADTAIHFRSIVSHTAAQEDTRTAAPSVSLIRRLYALFLLLLIVACCALGARAGLKHINDSDGK